MNKKGLTGKKTLCIIIMILIVVCTFFIGGMSSLNSRYEKINAYATTHPGLYNSAAALYNQQLEKFPANLIVTVMPVKGPLQYMGSSQYVEGAYDEDISEYMPVLSLGKGIGMVVVLILAGGLIKLLY